MAVAVWHDVGEASVLRHCGGWLYKTNAHGTRLEVYVDAPKLPMRVEVEHGAEHECAVRLTAAGQTYIQHDSHVGCMA